MFNTTKTFGPFADSPTFVLTVKANGGNVALQVKHSAAHYVTAETFLTDGAHQLFPGHAEFRLVPSGGAEYSLR